MKKENENPQGSGFSDVYPDISAIFDVEGKVAEPPAEKPAAPPKTNERILTAPEGLKHLPKAERKTMQKDARKTKRAIRVNKAKTRAIIILSAVLIVIIAALAIGIRIADSKKPVVSVARATVGTVVRSYADGGVIQDHKGRVSAIIIDNDYDVHFIAKGMKAEISTAEEETLLGAVSDIREIRPGDRGFEELTGALLGTVPEVPVYAVYVMLADGTMAPPDGSSVMVRVITDTIEKVLSVPTTAVMMDGSQPYVWVYHAFTKKLSRQDVTVGVISEEKTEIMRGLKRGDRVISGTSVDPSELYDGIKVKQR